MFGMDLSQIPLFAMLRGRLGYLADRQRVIAENVANSDTPGFVPRDLKPFAVHALTAADVAVASTEASQATTQPGHMALAPPGGKRSGFATVRARDSETRLDGNAVVLEEQMIKMGDARMDYDAAIGFYQKSLGLIRLAARAPGK